MVIIPDLTRKELYEMTTSELYSISGEVTSLSERIKAELIARGDY